MEYTRGCLLNWVDHRLLLPPSSAGGTCREHHLGKSLVGQTALPKHLLYGKCLVI